LLCRRQRLNYSLREFNFGLRNAEARQGSLAYFFDNSSIDLWMAMSEKDCTVGGVVVDVAVSINVPEVCARSPIYCDWRSNFPSARIDGTWHAADGAVEKFLGARKGSAGFHGR
jgi:hypothetical protein